MYNRNNSLLVLFDIKIVFIVLYLRHVKLRKKKGKSL